MSSSERSTPGVLDSTVPTALDAASVTIGYTLSSEEFSAGELVEHAQLAESAGFQFASISDHFHPWIDAQGESPFVWSTLGALSEATESIVFGTGVTCPTGRLHPAIVAQAAATTAELLPGRFYLGVGSGERLNEHILDGAWPDNSTRVDLLAEAIDLIRELWEGDLVSRNDGPFPVDRARIYSLPDELPPIYVASGGPESARCAAIQGDGLIGVAPSSETIETYAELAEPVGPRIGQIQFCVADTKDEGVATALEYWPNAAFGGNISQEIALPSDFEAIAELVTPEELSASITAGSDVQDFVDALNLYIDAGYDHIYFHQIGPRQQEAIDFVAGEVVPALHGQ